ncbi:hypothetical protein RclHR1_11370005 [Rhizophagus clarus]|uniref:Uncharacterized protein n=1 Tax=Rhizophagus clarus TaxID=94130 RepID=A0A2Z6Q4A8_9GLOM|nr:hypothetical protein RclHR1_11370005 [Rhizophagus clarus]
MDANDVKTIKEVTSNSFKKHLSEIFQTILPLCSQLCEGLTVTMAGAAKVFDKVPTYRLDPGLAKVKPKAFQQQVVASTVIATLANWSFSILLEQLVFPTYDKIALEVEEVLAAQTLRHQSEIDLLTDQLTKTGMAQTPKDHADLPDLDMDVDLLHQSTSSKANPPHTSSETSNNSWKQVLTKNQKKKLKKQEKRVKKAKFLQEAASLNSSTASPDSTLDSQKLILSQLQTQPSASAKRSEKSDDKIASLITKKRKNESSTGDNNLIITGYQPEENDKNLTLELVVYDIPAKWTNYQLLSELNKWEKVVSAYNNGDWTVSLSSLPVRWFPAAWSLSERKQREKFQAAITNIPANMTIESLFPEGTSGPFINKSNLQSFKIIQEQDGTRTLIGYFATWDALSRRRQPKATGSGSNFSPHKKAGSSSALIGSNRMPLGSRKSRNYNNHENNTNSLNLMQSQKLAGRSTSSNTNKRSRKSGNGHPGNLNKVKIKLLLEQLISLCC